VVPEISTGREALHSFVRFNEVGGLTERDPIQVNGVERGRVSEVDSLSNGVVVEMAVREGSRFRLTRTSRFEECGHCGERFVWIQQGDSTVAISPGDTPDGEYLMGLSEVMGRGR
jgi:hypothetical protein